MTNLLIATRNAHKVVEIRDILGEQFRYLTLDAFPDAPALVEDAPSFAGNATKKAVHLAKWLMSLPAEHPVAAVNLAGKAAPARFVLADDSGLEVDALHGAPGVHSARFAALDTGASGNSPTTANNAKLLRLLQTVPLEKRTARFRCALALTPVLERGHISASPACGADELELQTELFEGSCEGRIELAPRGRGGFGYDPLFVPEGYTQTFGELPERIKNQLSHRAQALEKLRQHLGR